MQKSHFGPKNKKKQKYVNFWPKKIKELEFFSKITCFQNSYFSEILEGKKYFCIRCIFCIFTRKTMHKWRRMCKYFVIYEKAEAEDRFFKFASKVRRGAGKIGSDVLTLIKLIDHDLIWRDEKLHSSIIQDKKSVLERSESRKKLERLLTFSQNFFHNELFKWHLF